MATAAGDARFLGVIRAFHRGVGLGFVACGALRARLGRDVSVAAAEIAGFEVGDTISFAMRLDPEFGTPWAVRLEAAPEAEAAAALELQAVSCVKSEDAIPDDEGRVAATRTLEAISRGTDKHALRQALAAARRAGVARDRLEAGEKALRRLVTEDRLRVLVRDDHVAPLREACTQALDAGFENRLLGTAADTLGRRAAAIRELQEAADRRDELGLRVALSQARAAGVQAHTMRPAQETLKTLTAARRLAAAVADMDEASLRLSLARAQELNLRGRTVAEAEGALKRIAAINDLAAAVCGTDDAELQGAIAAAREAGVNCGTLEDAERALRRLVVSKKLALAVDGGEADALREALAEARTAGVARPEVQMAEGVAARLAAGEELDRAIEDGDEVALRVAIALAAEAGVARPAVERGERTLRQLVATQELEAAVDGGDAEFLRRALLQAADADVQDVTLWDAAVDAPRRSTWPPSSPQPPEQPR